MKRIILLILLVFMGAQYAKSQTKIITVVEEGVSTYYTNLDTAIFNADTNAKIYLRGGNYGVVIINKKVHLIGVGYHCDSSGDFGYTSLTIALDSLANGSVFEGLRLGGSYRRTGSVINENLRFENCWLEIRSGSFCSVCSIHAKNSSIVNCLVGGGGSLNLTSSIIQNSVIVCRVESTSSIIVNCVVQNRATGSSNTYRNTIFQKGIFNTYIVSNCIFKNCINVKASLLNSYGNIGSSNANADILLSDMLVQPSLTGDCSWDYSFQSGSSYSKIGTDGKVVGVFGGSTPFNLTGRPSNVPFIKSSTVGTETDENGGLRIQFEILPNGK